MREKQVASFVGSIAVLTKNKGGNIGDRSAWCGPSSHSERPVESEVCHAGLTPTDRFFHAEPDAGESGLHCTKAALRLAFAKTPHPELRQQTFTVCL